MKNRRWLVIAMAGVSCLGVCMGVAQSQAMQRVKEKSKLFRSFAYTRSSSRGIAGGSVLLSGDMWVVVLNKDYEVSASCVHLYPKRVVQKGASRLKVKASGEILKLSGGGVPYLCVYLQANDQPVPSPVTGIAKRISTPGPFVVDTPYMRVLPGVENIAAVALCMHGAPPEGEKVGVLCTAPREVQSGYERPSQADIGGAAVATVNSVTIEVK